MPTSTRYGSIVAQLTSHLPDLRQGACLIPLACALVGMRQTVSAQQRAVASAMPLRTKPQSKIQRLRRLLDNAKLTAKDVYHPIVRAALTGLRRQRVHLLLDRVVLTETQNVLVVSLAFRRRSVPLVWHILPHQGSSYADRSTERCCGRRPSCCHQACASRCMPIANSAASYCLTGSVAAAGTPSWAFGATSRSRPTRPRPVSRSLIGCPTARVWPI